MYSPRERIFGLTDLALAVITPAELSAKLSEQNILIRYTPNPCAHLRRYGINDTEAAIDHLAETVDTIRKGLYRVTSPPHPPPRRWEWLTHSAHIG